MTEISTILTDIEKQLKIASNAIVCPTMGDEDRAHLLAALAAIARLTRHGVIWVVDKG